MWQLQSHTMKWRHELACTYVVQLRDVTVQWIQLKKMIHKMIRNMAKPVNNILSPWRNEHTSMCQ